MPKDSKYNPQLLQAVKQHNNDKVIIYLKLGASIDQKDESGIHLLDIAYRYHDYTLLHELLSRSDDANDTFEKLINKAMQDEDSEMLSIFVGARKMSAKVAFNCMVTAIEKNNMDLLTPLAWAYPNPCLSDKTYNYAKLITIAEQAKSTDCHELLETRLLHNKLHFVDSQKLKKEAVSDFKKFLSWDPCYSAIDQFGSGFYKLGSDRLFSYDGLEAIKEIREHCSYKYSHDQNFKKTIDKWDAQFSFLNEDCLKLADRIDALRKKKYSRIYDETCLVKPPLLEKSIFADGREKIKQREQFELKQNDIAAAKNRKTT